VNLNVYPWRGNDRMWTTKNGNLIGFVVKNLEIQDEKKTPKKRKPSTLGIDVFSTFLSELWKVFPKLSLAFQVIDRIRIEEACITRELGQLYETFSVSFIKRSVYPFKKVKHTKSSNKWSSRFNHFFPRNEDDEAEDAKKTKTTYGSKYSPVYRHLTYLQDWRSIMTDELISKAEKNLIRQELSSLFEKLEWLPNHAGKQKIWRLHKQGYEIAYNENKHFED
jgi:hypothetical protein